jgi:phospholipase C
MIAVLTAAVTFSSTAAEYKRHFHTATPIKHVVVIFGENISFDHYFGTYPHAENNPGETPFHASPWTPGSINTLLTPLDVTKHFEPLLNVDLLNHNPNSPQGIGAAINGANATNPYRLGPPEAATSDQNHADTPEQNAYNNGLVDGFPAFVGNAEPGADLPTGSPPALGTKGAVMGYFDGNTVTALWNYAQNFAMSDNHFSTQFGPSSPGAINLIAGQSNGFAATIGVTPVGTPPTTTNSTNIIPDGQGGYTLIGDVDPIGDVCSTTSSQVTFASKNIGDLLNEAGVTWGWFEGGFNLGIVNPDGTTGCKRHTNPTVSNYVSTSADYIPHHQPFQYYTSTANPTHARPSSLEAIGHSTIPFTQTPEPANHQYDSQDFFDALAIGNLPAVTFLKAPAYQDGHGGYSNPIDEQHFIVDVINALQLSPEWASTAVILMYDDSDGWYDHQMPPIVNPSFNPVADTLNGPGLCNNGLQQRQATPKTPLLGTAGLPVNGRCGYGPRQPFLIVSPFAKWNHVDHRLIDQSSVIRFIEDNWLYGKRIQPGGSFDTIAGSLEGLFDFYQFGERRLLLRTDGTPIHENRHHFGRDDRFDRDDYFFDRDEDFFGRR